MRRFSRRRRGGSSSDASIDAGRWLGRILEEKLVPLANLEPLGSPAVDEVPASLAAVGMGEDEQGAKTLVSFAPRFAGDALFGGLVAALRLAEEEQFSGELVVVAPQWSLAARRRLGIVSPSGFRVRGLAAPSLADAPIGVEAELLVEPGVVPIESLAGPLVRPADRELFLRAAAALGGLAAKHGGAVRGYGRGLELVVMARRVAELRADPGGVVLNTVLPSRSTLRLSAEGLSAALDGLEGNLRKRLNERRTRDGEEGMRTRLIPLVTTALGLRSTSIWPLGGNDLDRIDVVGLNGDGSPVVVASGGTFTLQTLGLAIDAALELRSSLPNLLADAQPPVRLEQLRVALAAKEFAPGISRLLPALGLAHDLLEIRGGGRERGLEVSVLGSGEAAPIAEPRKRSPRRGERGREARGESADDAAEPAKGEKTEGKGEAAASDQPRGRGRRRGRRSRGDRGAAAADTNADEGADLEEVEDDEGKSEKGAHRKSQRFEEMSSFDLLEEEARGDGDEGPARSRRRGGRSRRRGRRSAGEAGASGAQDGADAPSADDAEPVPPDADGDDDDDVELDESDLIAGRLAALPDSVDDDEATEKIDYDPDEELDEDADPEVEQRTIAREQRRRRRKAGQSKEPAPVVEEPPKPVRRRAAIVAHADRDSLIGAVLLARDLRLLEGIWVYTQEELMTFFRSVATDLREETPIYLVGFTPYPSRDIIQAASIYRDRLTWFDHQEWPPEDTVALQEAIGEDQVRVAPGAMSSLPLILQGMTRRSRFSDKLVDLAAGRFTEHDYERWGRLWWVRLEEYAQKSGQRRPDLEPLLNGRPSDLAKEAASIQKPPIPKEVVFVSERDFRLIHFAGHSLVVVEVPPELDLHLCARIARERYSASLSLALVEGNDIAVLAGEEGTGRNSQDCGSVAAHLEDKFGWVKGLPDEDHVARFLVEDRALHPDRLEDVIGAIAMARSLFDR